MPARLGILLSGSGTTYENLVRRVAADGLDARFSLVVASRNDCTGLERSRRFGHPSLVACEPQVVAAALREAGCEWVLMCGWLKYFDPPADFTGRVLNIHPSLLPSFGGRGMYGRRVHEAVVAAGVRVSGCTVHLVEGAYDTGPILAQRTVRVDPGDDAGAVEDRVRAAEYHLYPLVLAALLAAGVRGQGRRRWLQPVAGLDREDRGFAPG